MSHYLLILSLNYYRKPTSQVRISVWIFFCVVTYLNAIFRELKSSIMYQKNAQLKIIAIHKFVETCPSAIICGMKIGNVQNAVKEIDAITMLL